MAVDTRSWSRSHRSGRCTRQARSLVIRWLWQQASPRCGCCSNQAYMTDCKRFPRAFWTVWAKEFLTKEGGPFETRDVSVGRQAAFEMMRRTRQNGVPVIADDQEAIVGFDMPRLQRMAARHRRGGGMGLKVADATDGPGAY